ncbi:hypothetical protein pb186bvf_006685 [Paramecium bursaria]
MKVQLKFKHLFGEPLKEKFEQLTPTTQTCDSTMVKGNPKFTAFIVQTGGGGVVGVLENAYPQKLALDHPMIKGQSGAILDLDFYPFDDHYLATSTSDSTVQIWKIPEKIEADITQPVTILGGHDKKVNLIQWNPVASWLLASASHDSKVKVWDVQASKDVLTVNSTGQPISIEWDYKGHLIGSTWNDKKIRLIDPRAQRVASESVGHSGTKPQRFSWLGSTGLFVTVGFNKQMEREYFLWDSKQAGQPLQSKTLDQGSGVIYPYYDDQLNILYFTGKGDSSIKYFELVDGQLHYLNSFASTTPGKGYGFFPKRAVDVNRNEVARAIKIEEKALEFISFVAPRRSANFQEDLYPPCPGNEPAATSQEWLAGANVEPKLFQLRPDQQQNAQNNEDVVFQQQDRKSVKPQQQQQPQQQPQQQQPQQHSVSPQKEHSVSPQKQQDAHNHENELKEENAKLKQEQQSLKQEVERLQRNLQDQSQQSNNYQRVIQELQSRIHDLETIRSKQTQQIQEYQENVARLQNQLQETQEVIEELRSQLPPQGQ